MLLNVIHFGGIFMFFGTLHFPLQPIDDDFIFIIILCFHDFYYLIISVSAAVSISMLGIEVGVDMTVPIRLAGPPIATVVRSRVTVVTVICTEAVDVDCRGSVRTV